MHATITTQVNGTQSTGTTAAATASASGPARRLVTMAAAAVAAAAIWSIAAAGGMTLYQPAARAGATAPKLILAMVIAAPVIAALAGWAVSALIGRRAGRPARVWFSVAAVALLLSLAGPLTGHGVSAADRLVLISMHLSVGAIIAYGMRPAGLARVR
jgi:hypothetical protein